MNSSPEVSRSSSDALSTAGSPTENPDGSQIIAQLVSNVTQPAPSPDAEQTAEDATEAYASLSYFRPPSPTNVIQLLDRTRSVANADASRLDMKSFDENMCNSVVTFPSMSKDEAQTIPQIVPTLFKYFHFATDASAGAKPGENPLEGAPPEKKLGFFTRLAASITGTPPSAKRRLSDNLTNRASSRSLAQGNRGIGPGASAAESTASPTAPSVVSTSSSSAAESSPRPRSRTLDVPGGGISSIDTASGGEASQSSRAAPPLSPRSRSPLPYCGGVEEDRDLLDLTHSEQEFLLRDLVHEYADIYFENPRAFAPFYKGHKEVMTRGEQARMVYHHMKGDTKNTTLQKLFHHLKSKIMSHIEFILEEKALKVARVLPRMINAADSAERSNAERNNNSISSTSSISISSSNNANSLDGSSGAPTDPSDGLDGTGVLSGAVAGISTGGGDGGVSVESGFGASGRLTIIGMLQTNKDEYLGAVNRVVGQLRAMCIGIMERVNERIASEIIPNYATIADYEAVNDIVLNILFEPDLRDKIQEYHAAYRKAASSFPGRLLLSDLFRNRIESRSIHDKITLNDLIVAVEECTGHLRHTIHGFMHAHPELLTEMFDQPPGSVISSHTATEETCPEKAKLAKIYRISSVAWLHSSRIYTKLFTPATYTLVKKLGVTDPRTFRLISENKFQEATWCLLDLGFDGPARKLEDWISKYILNCEFVKDAKNLGGGFTTTKILTLQPDDTDVPGITSHGATVLGVFKPKPQISLTNFQSMKDALVSNHKKEVAAYRIDRLLHLYHVPFTKSMLYEEDVGSIQYFIQDSVSARDMNELDWFKPKRAGKFDEGKGIRAALPRRIRMFDYLIDNRDRNLDNYLISTLDQRVILIDHSWSWQTPFVADELMHNQDGFLRSIVPHESIYQRVKLLHEHHELLHAELKHLLSSGNIDSLKHRLELLVKFVEKEVKANGWAEVFRVPNAEDGRTFDIEVQEQRLRASNSSMEMSNTSCTSSSADDAIGELTADEAPSSGPSAVIDLNQLTIDSAAPPPTDVAAAS